MQRFKTPLLLAVLLTAGVLGAQAPAPDATVQTPSQAPAQGQTPSAPVPGGGQLPTPAPRTPEETRRDLEQQSQQVSEMQARSFAAHLGLSQSQLGKLRPILSDRQKRLRGLVDTTAAPEADRRAKMQQIEEETEMHIRTILTPEQRRQYDALIARNRSQRARHAAMAARRAPVAPGSPVATPAAPAAPAAPPQQ